MFNDLIPMKVAGLPAPVSRRVRTRAAVCLLAGGALGHALPASAAAAFSPKAGTATLTYTYKLTGSGIDRPQSHERNVTWSVDDQWDTQVTMTAQEPVSMAGLHMAGLHMAGPDDASPKPPAGSDDPAVMMARVKKAMDKCGDDQGCVQREIMGAGAPTSAKAANWTGPRYQVFAGEQQTSHYRINEKSHEAYYDAACSSKNETPCAFDTAVAGDGEVKDDKGNTRLSTPLTAELDLAEGDLMFYIAYPGGALVKRTVTTASKDPHIRAGTFEATRSLKVGQDNKPLRVSCGECRTASGQIVQDLPDQLKGHTARLVIEWKFTRP